MSRLRSHRGGREELHGILVVDKPAGTSSATALADVCSRAGIATAGHTGTLDPLATGVLPIVLGAATKLATWLLADDKAYEAELELGLETTTLDVEGEITRRDPAAAAAVDEPAIRAALDGFRGDQDQVPPMFSSLKQDGVRLYALARAGVEVDRAPRRIRVDRLELLGFEPPRVRLAMTCSKGTYVRSLVRDLGDRLGCGATLTALRRTASGRFTLADAVPLSDVTPATTLARLIRPSRATGLPPVTVPDAMWPTVLDGRPLPPSLAPGPGPFQLLTEAGDVLAIAELVDGVIRLHRVLTYGTRPKKR